MNFILTIDGPAGSGKTTIAKMLARLNGFKHIDSGAIYRSIGYIFDGKLEKKDIENLRLDFFFNDHFKIRYRGEDMENYIRAEHVSILSSNVSKLTFVRAYVNSCIKKITAQDGYYVIDGRDAGSIIFPNADLKIFLNADLNERAERRAKQMNNNLEKTKILIKNRDIEDSTRAIAPLIKPENAIEIDTTGTSIEDTYHTIRELIYGNKNS